MKPTLEQVIAFAQSDLDAPKPPSPWEIALRLAGSLIASGRYSEPDAAVATAWTLVIPFYQGQADYQRHGQTLFDLAHHASAPEGASVVGGETGFAGGASEHIDVAELQRRNAEKWTRIERTTAAVVQAEKDLAEARAFKGRGRKARLDAAERAFDDAAQAQSKAYED